ncbi:hypothetical protein H6K96_12115, partial [Staphylococcus epidermidis]|nr:hypothetical protein [Staphylococcus epidermidis]
MTKKEYPKIIEIKEDGRMIALDKNSQLNTDLNEHTLTEEQQYEVFGEILLKKKQNDDPKRYYNERDYIRERQLEEENRKNKTIKRWLMFGVIALLIIVVIFVVRSCSNTNDIIHNDTQNNSSQ